MRRSPLRCPTWRWTRTRTSSSRATTRRGRSSPCRSSSRTARRKSCRHGAQPNFIPFELYFSFILFYFHIFWILLTSLSHILNIFRHCYVYNRDLWSYVAEALPMRPGQTHLAFHGGGGFVRWWEDMTERNKALSILNSESSFSSLSHLSRLREISSLKDSKT